MSTETNDARFYMQQLREEIDQAIREIVDTYEGKTLTEFECLWVLERLAHDTADDFARYTEGM